MFFQTSVGVTTPERCVLYVLTYFAVPTMSLICILNADEICRVRRAVLEQFGIKRIMINCSEYTHASREMAAHLTRRARTQYITTK